MDKIKSVEELKLYLKENAIITSDDNDSFYYKDGKVIHKFNGNSYCLDFEDFIDLFKEKSFYLKKEPQDVVDEEKDLEYYGRIQKSN